MSRFFRKITLKYFSYKAALFDIFKEKSDVRLLSLCPEQDSNLHAVTSTRP